MAKTKEEKDRSATQPDDNGIGQVPDPPYHGRWNLLVGVNFADAEGGETRIEAGVIDGSELPLDVADDLFVRNLLKKA